MANDIIIRTAKKDYICSCCGHIIHKGTEYLDKCIFNVGNVVKHDRYHDECPHISAVTQLMDKIEKEGGDLIACDGEGTKIHIVGVAYDDLRQPLFIYREWDNTHKHTLSIDCIYNFIDANGGSIVV